MFVSHEKNFVYGFNRTGEIHVYYGDLGEECVKIIFNGKGGKIGRYTRGVTLII